MVAEQLALLRSRPRGVIAVGALVMLGAFIWSLTHTRIQVQSVPIGPHPHRVPDHSAALVLIFVCGLVLVIGGVRWLWAERSARRLL